MVTVANAARQCWRRGDVAVGPASPLGNPFPIGAGPRASRGEVCAAAAEVFQKGRSVEEVAARRRLSVAEGFGGGEAAARRAGALQSIARRVAGGA